VSLLAQDAFRFESLAVRTRRASEFDADPQALAADFFQVCTVESLQKSQEICTQFGGAFDHSFLNQDAQCGPGKGAAHWVASERAAVVARFVHAQNLARRQYCGDRIKTSGKRFADDGDSEALKLAI
jgi:hypothetical protein